MHPFEKREWWALGGLLLLLVPFYFWLATAGLGIYASPDETANAVTIRQLDWYGRISVPEPLARDFPWMHPRSYVSQGDGIAPVGFVGWPWIISVFTLILGQGMVPILATLAALSVTIPLYGLLRRFGPAAAFVGVLVGMTFPTMILFGNRALFPQIGILVFGVWSLFLLSRLRSDDAPWKFGLIGLMVALACAARPTEIIWLLPWLVWFAKDLRPDRTRLMWAGVSALIPLVFIGGHAQLTYGAFWNSGYMVRDNHSVEMITLPATPGDPTRSTWFPFGIHPKYVLWNTWSFLVWLLLPWTLLLGGAACLIGYQVNRTKERDWKKLAHQHAIPLLAIWTVLFLVVYYGQGLYTDHVQRGAVTIANSFVRYLLPLAPLSALAAAYLFKFLVEIPPLASLGRNDKHVISSDRRESRNLYLAIGFVILLAGYGMYVATARDNEGLIATRTELARYHEVRRRTAEYFGPQDLILSDRSDKIFFPNHRAALVPATDEVARLVKAHPEVRVGLFARPLSQAQADAWRKSGFEPTELFVSGREKLYSLTPIRR